MTKGKSLTAASVKTQKQPGRYYDNQNTGLHLYVRASGAKSWVQRLRFNGKSIDIGLGNPEGRTLVEARSIAIENSQLAKKGLDPRRKDGATARAPTFREIASDALLKKQDDLGNAKHRGQWRTTLEKYAFPTLGDLPVDQIAVADVSKALTKIWKTKNETAQRTRGRIEYVLNYAITMGHASHPNPAVWKGNLEHLLAKPSSITKVQNMPAIQRGDAQRWWADLQTRDGNGAKALQVLTLVACRSGEIRGMRFGEIKFFSEKVAAEKGFLGIWTIPSERMKTRVEHQVPIIQPVKDILAGQPEAFELVFPSRKGKQLSDMTLSALMKRMHAADKVGYCDERSGRPAVPHGIRSTFRDWAAELGMPRDVTELQLAHRIGNQAEKAYFRADLLKRRAQLLDDWFQFLCGK